VNQIELYCWSSPTVLTDAVEPMIEICEPTLERFRPKVEIPVAILDILAPKCMILCPLFSTKLPNFVHFDWREGTILKREGRLFEVRAWVNLRISYCPG